MIISKTPLRISFVGGGSDLPAYFQNSGLGGAVVTTTINKYVYITVNKKFDNHIRLSYSKTESVEKISQIEHPIFREVLKILNLEGIEITSIADIPSKGTGLGSSSAFTVGLLNALYKYQNRSITTRELAELACTVEIDQLGAPIGLQDQFGTAFGGLKLLTFSSDGSVTVKPITCSDKTKVSLQKNLLLLYTGITRSASKILTKQESNIIKSKPKQKIITKMVKLAYDLKDSLSNNRIDDFGEILHANWMYKKELDKSISSSQIDHWYKTGRQAGAMGGKILGAGGGGFLLFYAPRDKHPAIIQALPELIPYDVSFEKQGSEIVFVD